MATINLPFSDVSYEEIVDAHIYINASFEKDVYIELEGLSKEQLSYIGILASHLMKENWDTEKKKETILKAFRLALNLNIAHEVCFYFSRLMKMDGKEQELAENIHVFIDIIDFFVQKVKSSDEELQKVENLENEYFRIHRRARKGNVEINDDFEEKYYLTSKSFLELKLSKELTVRDIQKVKNKI